MQPQLFFPDFFFLAAVFPSFDEIIKNALEGDVTIIALLGIGTIVCFILLVLIVEFANWMVGLTKRFFLFATVLAANLLFFLGVFEKAFSAGIGQLALAVAIIGSFFAVAALVISAISFKRQWFKPKDMKVAGIESEMKKLVAERFEEELEGSQFGEPKYAAAASRLRQQQAKVKEAFSPKNFLGFFEDSSPLAMPSYIIAAEFGAIAGLPVSIESPQLGLIVFAIFLIAAMVFIKSTYKDYLKGLKCLLIALLAGTPIAIAISLAWLGTPIWQLLSLDFFATKAMVGLMAGVIVGLLLGSKY